MLHGKDLNELVSLLEEAYDDLQFPEPQEWMKQIEQVVGAYKNEVELLRGAVREMQAAVTRIARDHRELLKPIRENNKILNELKQSEDNLKGK